MTSTQDFKLRPTDASKSQLLCCSALAAVAASPALAQDASKFEGVYLTYGATVGLSNFTGMSEISSYDTKDYNNVDFGFFDSESGQAMIGLGYDHAISANKLLGVRATVRAGSAASFSGSYYDDFGGKEEGLAGHGFFGEIGSSLTVSGRIGHVTSANMLFYVTAGVSVATYTAGGSYAHDEGDNFDWSDEGVVFGGMVGIGFEKMLASGMTLGAELGYSSYGTIASEFNYSGDEGYTSFDAESTQLTVFMTQRF